MLPSGGKRILDARLNSQRPAGGVFVVPAWEDRGRCEVVAEWGKRYDWRFLGGLQVFVMHDGYTGEVSKTVADIVQARPEFVAVISEDLDGYAINP